MDEEKYQKLLDAIQDSKRDVDNLERKLLSSIDDLKRDVTDVQQKASHELAAKINKPAYQFRRKGNEIQYAFNSSIDDSITAAKLELARVKPTDKGQQECLKKAEATWMKVRRRWGRDRSISWSQTGPTMVGQRSNNMTSTPWRRTVRTRRG